MRSLKREWKGSVMDGRLRSVRHTWTHRARWYEGDDIRIQLEDGEGRYNHYPDGFAEGQELWDKFKAGEINARGQSQR